MEIDEDECTVSFDVTSLYTNVPIKDTLNIIKDLLLNDENLHNKTSIPPDEFLEITEFVLTKTWFIFNNDILTQTDGVAMGGPASLVVAEIYMQAHEQTALTTFSNKPNVWERYVDDVFSIIKRCHLDSFFEHINSLHEQIKFTVEKENNSCLPFLDTCVKRNNDGKISVTVYRKPTHTDQYLNFRSHHQPSSKNSVISALFTRAERIISNTDDLEKENQRIFNVLKANNYSNKDINHVKRKLERKKQQPMESDREEEELNGYINLPYVRNTSEALRRIFKDHNIRCTFYTSETLRKLISHPKDRVPTEKRNNVVYQINCQDCSAAYIGETKRSFNQRSKEHQRAVTNCDTEKNEIAKHCWDKDHVMDWQNKKVIDQEQNMVARKIKETIHSIGNENSINGVSYNLPHIWLPALNKKRNVPTNIFPSTSAIM